MFKSCGVTFKNKHLIFGGDENKRQVLQVDNCGLTELGLIPFDHSFGACGSTDKVIVLCFDVNSKDAKECRQASSPSGPWTEMAQSSFGHRVTSIATSPGIQ